MHGRSVGWLLFSLIAIISCRKEEVPAPSAPDLMIQYARLGSESIRHGGAVTPNGNIVIGFSKPVAETSRDIFRLSHESGEVKASSSWTTDRKEVSISNADSWIEGFEYRLIISNEIVAMDGGKFPGDTLHFSIRVGPLTLDLRTREGNILEPDRINRGISLEPVFELKLSHPVPEQILREHTVWSGQDDAGMVWTAESDTSYSITFDQPLSYYTSFEISFSSDISEITGRPFEEQNFELFTQLDSTFKFPELTDEELLMTIQKQTFRYFWEGADPNSGMARERNSSGSTVTTGGTGFGLMAMIVAVERGFITRSEAIDRWDQIIQFLEKSDRFHGAWSHWIDGTTGKVRPFSQRDNGADLVETAFLVQGLLTVRQYLNPALPEEKTLIDRINNLWQSVEWDWFTKSGENVLYWHWSPEYEWAINLPIRGHNETQIVYILAASAPEHSIGKEVYDEGYARSGNMKNGDSFYNIALPLGPELGGPLFFTHYSYLGLDPRNLVDQYADYWEQNVNHTLINRAYCIDNPQNHIGYSEHCWGLTASDGNEGYSAHSPTNDRGVITPTAAISALPYTPEKSMEAIRHFYYLLGDRLWGEYGFYDAFNIEEEWVAESYLAIDQGPIICMIENYRSGMLWDLFMSAPEIRNGLEKLNISYE